MKKRKEIYNMRPDSFDSIFYGKWKTLKIKSHDNHLKIKNPFRTRINGYANYYMKRIGINPSHQLEIIYEYEIPAGCGNN